MFLLKTSRNGGVFAAYSLRKRQGIQTLEQVKKLGDGDAFGPIPLDQAGL